MLKGNGDESTRTVLRLIENPQPEPTLERPAAEPQIQEPAAKVDGDHTPLAAMESDKAPGKRRRRGAIIGAGGVLFLLVAGGGTLYWDNAGHFQSTDDAFVASREVSIAPKV